MGDEIVTKNVTPARESETTADRQATFLSAYADLGTVTKAAAEAGVASKTVYRWLAADPAFRADFELAKRAYIDKLEAEADRRAVQGVPRPVGWYKGVAGGTVREYSDSLLQFRLRALDPDRYADRVELKGALAKIDMSRLTDDQINRIAAGEHPLAVLGSSADAFPQLPPAPRQPVRTAERENCQISVLPEAAWALGFRRVGNGDGNVIRHLAA